MDSTNHTKTYFEIMLEPYMWTYNKLLFGMLAFLVSLPLLISSNGIFTSLLGKHWKTLQRLSYFMFIFVALHIYFLKKGRFGIIPLIILLVWIALYAFAHLKKSMSSQKVSQKSKKWLCVPCAYIYDEAV
jgi:DMSO/TMAO reductase YedYZ heme-binding membrane subunit